MSSLGSSDRSFTASKTPIGSPKINHHRLYHLLDRLSVILHPIAHHLTPPDPHAFAPPGVPPPTLEKLLPYLQAAEHTFGVISSEIPFREIFVDCGFVPWSDDEISHNDLGGWPYHPLLEELEFIWSRITFPQKVLRENFIMTGEFLRCMWEFENYEEQEEKEAKEKRVMEGWLFEGLGEGRPKKVVIGRERWRL